MLNIETAIDVFIDSFAFVHNLTQPCEVIHYESLRIIRDLPGPSSQLPQEEIIVPLDVAPDEVVARVRAYRPIEQHILDVFQRPGQSFETLKAAYQQLGYQPLGYEPLMVLELPALFRPEHPHPVQRVQTKAQASRVVKNARQKLIRPEDLTATFAPLRLYYVEEGGKVIAWGRSAQQHPNITYVAGMSTNQAHRRRGLAAAILSRLLADDAAQGAGHSLLLASQLGQPLYLKCGYEQIGSLHMFGPG